MVGDFETDKVSTIVTFGICSCKQSQNNKILTSTDDDIGGSNLQKNQKKNKNNWYHAHASTENGDGYGADFLKGRAENNRKKTSKEIKKHP